MQAYGMKIDLLSSATMVESHLKTNSSSKSQNDAQKHDCEDQSLKDQNEVQKQY